MPSAAKVRALTMVACVIVTALVGSAALGVATVFIVDSQPSLSVALILGSVEDDFEDMGRTCDVSFVAHCWHTTPDEQEPSTPASMRKDDGRPHCWQSYSARFTTATTRDNVYSSWPEFVMDGQRDCGSGCHSEDAMHMPSGQITSNNTYQCWRARHAVDRRFECNNNPCYKLSDPKLIWQRAHDEAYRLITLSASLYALALVSCCACACLVSKGLRGADEKNAVPTVTVMSAPPTTTSTVDKV